jgi:hypothetical protein
MRKQESGPSRSFFTATLLLLYCHISSLIFSAPCPRLFFFRRPFPPFFALFTLLLTDIYVLCVLREPVAMAT